MSGKIYAALVAIQAEVGVVGKTRKNPQQGYQFRGIDDVVAAVQELQAKHGVICAPRVVERERELVPTKSGGSMASVRLLVEHHFIATDGSEVVVTTVGEAMDSGDKASNKAMSAALKYALTQLYMIPTYEADRDTEEHSPEMASTRPRAATVGPAPKSSPVSRPPKSATAPTASQSPGWPTVPRAQPPDELGREVALLLASISTARTTADLDTLTPRLKALPKPEADQVRPAYAARLQELR